MSAHFIGKSGLRYSYEDIGKVIAEKHPSLVGEHIFPQLDALGLRAEFDGGRTSAELPYSFSDSLANPDPIQRHTFTTKEGHFIQFFFNGDTNLLVVDVVHKNEKGGNEIVRRNLDFKKLLPHAR